MQTNGKPAGKIMRQSGRKSAGMKGKILFCHTVHCSGSENVSVFCDDLVFDRKSGVRPVVNEPKFRFKGLAGGVKKLLIF